jgi:hypothetical protein
MGQVAADVAQIADAVAPPVDIPKVRTPAELAEAQARMDAAMRVMTDKPPMSLMEALASGKLNFDRSAD